LFWTINVALQAQEVVATSGGYGETSGARVIWTVGETVTETFAGTNSILTQGFNQGDFIVTVIRKPELPGLIIKAYPNPANDYLRLSVADTDFDNLNYVLLDIGGRLLHKDVIKGSEYEIPLKNLTPSIYFLKIYQRKKEIAIFKIIKN